MDIGAHPHIGLQTVTWLLDGELVHYDSLGSESLLRPGGVNVMTSGGPPFPETILMWWNFVARTPPARLPTRDGIGKNTNGLATSRDTPGHV
jgi:redox-sensitive bicupin YhaK (pirin superfamily)